MPMKVGITSYLHNATTAVDGGPSPATTSNARSVRKLVR
jgi:hypothetical protein